MGLDVDLGFLNRRQVSQNRKPESPMHIATATVVSWWIVECQDARVARNPDIQSRISREAGVSETWKDIHRTSIDGRPTVVPLGCGIR